MDAKEKRKLKKKQKQRNKKLKEQMALFSQFDEAAAPGGMLGGGGEPGKKRKTKANKLSPEEIDNLTAEELEKYIMNEGKRFSQPKKEDELQTGERTEIKRRPLDPNNVMCKFCNGKMNVDVFVHESTCKLAAPATKTVKKRVEEEESPDEERQIQEFARKIEAIAR